MGEFDDGFEDKVENGPLTPAETPLSPERMEALGRLGAVLRSAANQHLRLTAGEAPPMSARALGLATDEYADAAMHAYQRLAHLEDREIARGTLTNIGFSQRRERDDLRKALEEVRKQRNDCGAMLARATAAAAAAEAQLQEEKRGARRVIPQMDSERREAIARRDEILAELEQLKQRLRTEPIAVLAECGYPQDEEGTVTLYRRGTAAVRVTAVEATEPEVAPGAHTRHGDEPFADAIRECFESPVTGVARHDLIYLPRAPYARQDRQGWPAAATTATADWVIGTLYAQAQRCLYLETRAKTAEAQLARVRDETAEYVDAMDAAAAQRDATRKEVEELRARIASDVAKGALDEIAAACGAASWDYPGQVIRDVKKLAAEAAEQAEALEEVAVFAGYPEGGPEPDSVNDVVNGVRELAAQCGYWERAATAWRVYDRYESGADPGSDDDEEVCRRLLQDARARSHKPELRGSAATQWLRRAGGEAEDLRRAFEKLMAEGGTVSDEDRVFFTVDDIQGVLDDVDARDSLAFVIEQQDGRALAYAENPPALVVHGDLDGIGTTRMSSGTTPGIVLSLYSCRLGSAEYDLGELPAAHIQLSHEVIEAMQPRFGANCSLALHIHEEKEA